MTVAEKIQNLIDEAQRLLGMRVTSSDQAFYSWRLKTEDFLKSKFASESREKHESDEKARARQNAIFEAGYFMGKLGRKKVIVISEQNIEMPSDLQGVLYTSKYDWKLAVCRELKLIGYTIDANKLI